jgi:hypothetical protein
MFWRILRLPPVQKRRPGTPPALTTIPGSFTPETRNEKGPERILSGCRDRIGKRSGKAFVNSVKEQLSPGTTRARRKPRRGWAGLRRDDPGHLFAGPRMAGALPFRSPCFALGRLGGADCVNRADISRCLRCPAIRVIATDAIRPSRCLCHQARTRQRASIPRRHQRWHRRRAYLFRGEDRWGGCDPAKRHRWCGRRCGQLGGSAPNVAGGVRHMGGGLNRGSGADDRSCACHPPRAASRPPVGIRSSGLVLQ